MADSEMRICAKSYDKKVIFELNNNAAAKELYSRLPLSVNVESFDDNERVLFMLDSLNAADAPVALGEAGTLAYYEPWGDVVMFHRPFGGNGSLFELGKAVEGAEHIEAIADYVILDRVEA